MPRPRTASELIHLYFCWRLFRDAEGTWKADGRSNQTKRRPTLCRGTKAEALTLLREFDLQQAVEFHLVPPEAAAAASRYHLTITDSLAKYQADVASRKVTLDVSDASIKRSEVDFIANRAGVARRLEARFLGDAPQWNVKRQVGRSLKVGRQRSR